ncbi:hypothetical protein BaRGS_00012203 [Batillaria attramentaria]|uniref:Uncharacterized protein n=1 Tax=Batillaria attramentaria TaxID=370345 RepID=A0ABD0LB84_9CAEN
MNRGRFILEHGAVGEDLAVSGGSRHRSNSAGFTEKHENPLHSLPTVGCAPDTGHWSNKRRDLTLWSRVRCSALMDSGCRWSQTLTGNRGSSFYKPAVLT